MEVSELIEQAIERGYVRGVEFFDVIYKRLFTIQRLEYTDFGKDGVKLYVRVEKSPDYLNKTACIYYKGVWAGKKHVKINKGNSNNDDNCSKNNINDFYYNLFEYNKRRHLWTEKETIDNFLGK